MGSRVWAGVATATAMLAGLIVIGATFRDYGITWDEGVQSRYGELALDYFASGFEDRSYREFHDLRYYGALFELIGAGIYTATGAPPFETRHLLRAIGGLLTVLGVLRLARIWGDPWVAVYGGLALAVMPRFYGHAFINSKDIPFACCFTWAMLAIAFLAALGYSLRAAKARGLPRDPMMDLWIASLVSGIIGAKLLLYLLDLDYYLSNPQAILHGLRSAGVFYGGLLAALGTCLWMIRRKGLPGWLVADIAALQYKHMREP